MAIDLHLWRNERGFTQMEAARHLGVSQPYLSLLERGARPITDKLRTRLSRADQPAQSPDDKFRAQLSALGYAGFAHIAPARCPEPSSFLMEAISQPDLDARITAALPWLACERAVQIDWPWLVREAKLRDLQNRLGFLTKWRLAVLPGRGRSSWQRMNSTEPGSSRRPPAGIRCLQ